MKPSERINRALSGRPGEHVSDNVYILRAFSEIGIILDGMREDLDEIQVWRNNIKD